ncbi:phage tail fiber protein [Entomohabitans teleogrylli]|uniref:phage tail fiber protein n=1 Tax=Entomohabitans teleogrylli TaxID=1384589 RepID=UPI00073D22E8|nr:hypothetical protein [Entomohabitans teleogrylli]
MTNDISGFGLRVTLRASVMFPAGITLTQFADDADPLDSASLKLGDAAIGLNGDMVSWRTLNAIPVTLNILPNSDDDKNLRILAEANRVAKGKKSTNDSITMTIYYPSGETRMLTGGTIVDAMIGNGVTSSGRLKTKSYAFKFENQVIV